MKGIVKIGAVNADEDKALGQQYGVTGFPTIKIFGTNKRSPTNYQGGRTADAIIDQALGLLKTIVNERLGKRSGGGGSSGGSGSGSGAKDTIELTDSNFEVNYFFLLIELIFFYSILLISYSQQFSIRKICGLLNSVSFFLLY